MEKQCQLYLSYADNRFTCNISLYRTITSSIGEVVLAGVPDGKFKMITTIILDALFESAVDSFIFNINDVDFYENRSVNEFAVGGVVTIISSAIEQGATVAVITDDANFRNVIYQAFRKHKKFSKVNTFSTTDYLSL